MWIEESSKSANKPTNSITVRIWLPEQTTVLRAILGDTVGHASINLRVNGKKYYITWSADGNPLAGVNLPPFHGIQDLTRKVDAKNMVGFFGTAEPHRKFKLPTMQSEAGSNSNCIDPYAIESFWLDRLRNMPKYSFSSVSDNCTGCVADALRAGGMEQFVPMPKPWFVQDAGSLLAWLIEAEKKIGSSHQPC